MMKQKKQKNTTTWEHSKKKGKSIFECEAKQKEMSGDTIKTDCMNHGYRIIRTLGEGAYAKVKLAEVMASRLARNEEMSIKSEFNDGELQVAIKVISKTSVPKEFLMKFLPREVENHTKMPEHPYIARIYDNFNTQEHVYLVMEYCKNGDLLDLINKYIGTNQKGIGEEMSRKIFRQICEGVQHIHSNNVVHRDLKCENVLLDENLDAKLTDFGFSASIKDPKAMLRTSCGSYAYTAPEVIRNKPYEGFKADIWSLGIMLFAMINGRLPFNDSQMLEMDEDMKMQRLRFERSTTFDCMVLIRKLLQYHPSERPSLDLILNDPWLSGKKPIPRQVQRPKYVPQNQAAKESPNAVHTPAEILELPPNMRKNTICYRPDASPRSYTETLMGTITLNQKAGETVTLKSRSGRAFQKKITIPTRPATWPRSKEGSPQPTKSGNKSRQPHQTHKGADIRNVAKLIVDKYKQGEAFTNSKDISKQVPLWLLNQILTAEGHQNDFEKATLLGKHVSQPQTPTDSPSPGCIACAVVSRPSSSGTEKQESHIRCDSSASQKKKSKTTLRKSAHSEDLSSLKDDEAIQCSTPSYGEIPSPTTKKQMINYSSPIPVSKRSASPECRHSVRPNIVQLSQKDSKGTVTSVPPSGYRLYNDRFASTRATTVSNGFKFKVITPASRANMCRERKMQAYTNQAFQQAVWPLPFVHGSAVQSLPCDQKHDQSKPTQVHTAPREVKVIYRSEESRKVKSGSTSVTPRHKLVVHVAS